MSSTVEQLRPVIKAAHGISGLGVKADVSDDLVLMAARLLSELLPALSMALTPAGGSHGQSQNPVVKNPSYRDVAARPPAGSAARPPAGPSARPPAGPTAHAGKPSAPGQKGGSSAPHASHKPKAGAGQSSRAPKARGGKAVAGTSSHPSAGPRSLKAAGSDKPVKPAGAEPSRQKAKPPPAQVAAQASCDATGKARGGAAALANRPKQALRRTGHRVDPPHSPTRDVAEEIKSKRLRFMIDPKR